MIVCFFGDSLVKGVGDPAGLGWPGRLVHQSGLSDDRLLAYNLGIRRNDTAAIRNRFLSETSARMLAGQEMRLVFSLGSVDVLTMESIRDDSAVNGRIEHVAVRTAEILALAADFPTLFVGPPPNSEERYNRALDRLDTALAGTVGAAGVPYLSIFHELASSGMYIPDLSRDGVHPGPCGYDLISRLVDDWKPWQEWLAHAAA